MSMTDFGFFEAKGVCPICKAVMDNFYKLICDTCQDKREEE